MHVPIFAAGLLSATACAAPEANRPLQPETLAWWTFDNHLRDEKHGLELHNIPNPNPETEKLYVSIQWLNEVPVLQIGGRPNLRAYYRWGVPSLTYGRLADQMDPPGPFTVELYLCPRSDEWMLKQARAFILRKGRGHHPQPLQPQWALELRRHSGQERRRGDLWASVTFLQADGRTAAVELLANDALRMGDWQHVALVYDGQAISLLVDRKPVASAPAAGPGARVLPSAGKSTFYISSNPEQVDGQPAPSGSAWLATTYNGRLDEVRVTAAALAGDALLPPVQQVSEEPLPDPPARSEYTSLVRRHLDLLMKHGTDVYGPVHSPLIGSTLDPQTLRMLEVKPAILRGMPDPYDPYRSPLYGCNLDFMRNTLMAMEALSAVTGDPRYQTHADQALRYWFDHCIYPSGVWPLGEHGVWNFYTDQPEPVRAHEPGAHLDFEKYYAIAPDKVARYIDLMHQIHVFQYEGKWFHDRHGSSEGHPHAVGGCGFPRHSGLFARAWAFLYSKTRNPKYLQWARDQLDLLWSLRDPKTDLVPGQIFPPPGTTFQGQTVPAGAYATTSTIYAALGFLDAVQWLDRPEDKKLFFERACTLALANFRAYYAWDGKQFTDTRPRWMSSTTAPAGHWLLLKFWERADKPAFCLDHCRRLADARLASPWRPTRNTDAGAYGWEILFFVQLHNETRHRPYLDYARRLADYAAANLVLDNGLVVGSGYYRVYDEMYHVPKLVQAFLAVDHPAHAALRPILWEPIF